jgi:hypothetical protein
MTPTKQQVAESIGRLRDTLNEQAVADAEKADDLRSVGGDGSYLYGRSTAFAEAGALLDTYIGLIGGGQA